MKEAHNRFTWNLRISSNREDQASVFVRQHAFRIGAPIHFDKAYSHITALEYVLGAIAADIVTGLQAIARKRRVEVDQVEAVVEGELNNALTYLSVIGEQGHPGLQRVGIKVYISSLATEERIHQVWEETLAHSPMVHTFKDAIDLQLEFQVTI